MKKILFSFLVCFSLSGLQAQCDSFGIDVIPDLTACEGDSATLIVIVTGGTAPFDLDYTYYDTNATYLNGSGTLSQTTLYALYTHHQNATFYYSVMDANGCVDGDTVTIYNAICDSIATSLKTLGLAQQILLYPNPSKGTMFLEVSDLALGAVLNIYNTLDQVVFKHLVSQTTSSLDVSHLDQGLYFATLSQHKKVMWTEKMILHK